MLDLLAASDGVSPWFLVLTSFLSIVGVAVGQGMTRLGERSTRQDNLKSYKRNIYRNFLDHGYWLTQNLEDAKQEKKAELYVADWHRIRLITDDERVLKLTKDLKEPARFNESVASDLLAAFRKELGFGGLNEP